jgi:hypothetical protein
MRNIAPLRQMNEQIAQANVHLYDPVDPVRGVDQTLQVYYYLEEDADSVTIEFLDGSGSTIETFVGTPADEGEDPDESPFARFFGGDAPKPAASAGSHMFRWTMRYPGYTDFDGRIFWAAGNVGPLALPDRYQVRLSAGDVTQTQDFEIKLDSRLESVTIAQLRERFQLALSIRDRVSEANEAVVKIRGINGEVDDRLDKTDDRAIHQQGTTVKDKLSGVEQEIYQVRNESRQDPLNFPIKLNNKLAALMFVVESGETEPTDQSEQVFEHLSGLLQTELIRMNTIIQQDLARLNELLRGANLDPIVVDEELIGDN